MTQSSFANANFHSDCEALCPEGNPGIREQGLCVLLQAFTGCYPLGRGGTLTTGPSKEKQTGI